MAWLNVKNPEPEDSSQKVSYDEVPLFDFLVTRVRLFVIENRDVISVSLILIMGFAVFWTVRVSSQPTTVGTQAADETNRINNNSGITPTPMVTILVVTATPPITDSPTIIPTLPLQELPTFTPTPTPLGISSSPRPTNPFWEYLK